MLPTGHACANHAPPVGAVANALHALTLLIARQLVSELENLGPEIEYYVVPPLCPLVGSPYDFSRTADHIERAILRHRRLAGAARPAAGQDSARDAAARPLNGRRSLHCIRCTAKARAGGLIIRGAETVA